MRATFNVMFFVQKGKCKADGTAPILARLTVNQEKIPFSTKQSIDPQRWDTKRYRTLGVTKAEKNINGMLDELQASIQRHFFDLQAVGRGYFRIQNQDAPVLDRREGQYVNRQTLRPLHR